MENFNAICFELQRKLALTGEVDGVIYWYEGVPQLLVEMIRYLLPKDMTAENTQSDDIRLDKENFFYADGKMEDSK